MCDRLFQFGPGRYQRKYIQHYEITLCNHALKLIVMASVCTEPGQIKYRFMP